jgi:hypothetical protein
MSEMGSMADLDVEHRHVWFPASYGHHSDMRRYGISRPVAELNEQCPKTTVLSPTPRPNFATFFKRH